MSRVKIEEGNRGEEIAVKYLQDKGYKIIDRNFRLKGGEIDIVAVKDGILIFVEVKTRTSNQFGTGFEAITSWKIKSLIKSAYFYKATHRDLPEEMRIDAVSIMVDNFSNSHSIEHIENITF
jgi:putative endonuclease